MTFEAHTPRPYPATSIELTIAQHGPLRVLVASAVALLHGPELRPPPTDADSLNRHLRKDVGMSPLPPLAPPPPGFRVF